MTRCLQATGYFGIQEKIDPVFGVEGGFQLESLSINRIIKSHDLLYIRVLLLMENSLQNLLSGLNAVISTNCPVNVHPTILLLKTWVGLQP